MGIQEAYKRFEIVNKSRRKAGKGNIPIMVNRAEFYDENTTDGKYSYEYKNVYKHAGKELWDAWVVRKRMIS